MPDNTARWWILNSWICILLRFWVGSQIQSHPFYNIVFDGFYVSQYVKIRYPFRFHPKKIKPTERHIIIIANAISKSPFKSTFPSFCLSPKTKQNKKVTIQSEIFAEMEYFTSILNKYTLSRTEKWIFTEFYGYLMYFKIKCGHITMPTRWWWLKLPKKVKLKIITIKADLCVCVWPKATDCQINWIKSHSLW